MQRSLTSIASDGLEEAQGTANMRVRTRQNEVMQVTLLKDWQTIQTSALARRQASETVLRHLLSKLPNGARGADLLVETTIGQLIDSLNTSPSLDRSIDADRLLQQALLWLHDQEVIRLNRGMLVFRSAMTIRLKGGRNRFLQSDFEPLQIYYDEQTLQIHIMAEYAEKGLQSVADAVGLTLDYFSLPRQEFVTKWLADKKQELTRQTTPESWRRIVESLNNRTQRAIVADNRENTNVLVLAGPGSGKTRVLVHRIAYLVRARRENPRSIPGTGIQPARRHTDTAASAGPDWRRFQRSDSAHLSCARYASGRLHLRPLNRGDRCSGADFLRQRSQRSHRLA